MDTSTRFRVFVGDWGANREAIRAVRSAVFVEEQGVPAELEADDYDSICAHVLAVRDDGKAIGTGRLLDDGHIGRLAVLRETRGRGIGAALLEALVDLAGRRGMREVVLNAQLQAIPFYMRHGFRPHGDVFLESGIQHRLMRREIGA
jgi:predicted GNAT family N-acyltransferase